MNKPIFMLVGCVFAVTLMLFVNPVLANQNSAESDVDEAPLTIAVASNFKYALEQLIALSPYWSHQDIRLVTGSSGVLYAQILKGAPFDVFLSADTERPSRLVQSGYANKAAVYAIGRLVLWSGLEMPNKPKVEVNEQLSYRTYLTNFEGKLAIADPRLAPFGKAALEVIESSPEFMHLKNQLVKGTNVNQAFQFVDSSNAQAGLIAQSLLIQARELLGAEKYHHYMDIPPTQYSRIEQAIVALKTNRSHSKSEAFVEFMLSLSTQAKLAQLGYDRP